MQVSKARHLGSVVLAVYIIFMDRQGFFLPAWQMTCVFRENHCILCGKCSRITGKQLDITVLECLCGVHCSAPPSDDLILHGGIIYHLRARVSFASLCRCCMFHA